MNQQELNLPALAKAEALMRQVERGLMILMREYPAMAERLQPMAQDAAEAANLLRVQGIGMDQMPPGGVCANLDTENSRLLVGVMDDAVFLGSVVDRERGRTYQGKGADYAASLGVILERLRAEVEPPQGRD